MFKIGDSVRCIDCTGTTRLAQGQIYKVYEVEHDKLSVGLMYDRYTPIFYNANRFTLVKDNETMKSNNLYAFKPNDHVRLRNIPENSDILATIGVPYRVESINSYLRVIEIRLDLELKTGLSRQREFKTYEMDRFLSAEELRIRSLGQRIYKAGDKVVAVSGKSLTKGNIYTVLEVSSVNHTHIRISDDSVTPWHHIDKFKLYVEEPTSTEKESYSTVYFTCCPNTNNKVRKFNTKEEAEKDAEATAKGGEVCYVLQPISMFERAVPPVIKTVLIGEC